MPAFMPNRTVPAVSLSLGPSSPLRAASSRMAARTSMDSSASFFMFSRALLIPSPRFWAICTPSSSALNAAAEATAATVSPMNPSLAWCAWVAAPEMAGALAANPFIALLAVLAATATASRSVRMSLMPCFINASAGPAWVVSTR